MCSPERGENKPEDVDKEALLMEERECVKDRRPPRFAPNGVTKMIAVALLSMTFGFFLPQILRLTREGGGIEHYMEADEVLMSNYGNRIRSLEGEIAEGKRWTLENQMGYASSQQQEIATLKINQVEHIANCTAAWEKTNETLQRLDKRMERIEKKM